MRTALTQLLRRLGGGAATASASQLSSLVYPLSYDLSVSPRTEPRCSTTEQAFRDGNVMIW